MTRARSVLACLLLATSPAVAQGEKPGEKESQAAQKVAETYIGLIKEKKAEQALKDHWSFETLCQAIFKDELAKQSAEDRAACAKGIHDLLVPSMTDPEIAEVMAKAVYEKWQAAPPKDGKVEVSFVVTLEIEGVKQEPTKQFLWVQKVGDALKIVDMARGDPKQGIAGLLAAQYAQAKQDTPTLTPLAYVRLMGQGQ